MKKILLILIFIGLTVHFVGCQDSPKLELKWHQGDIVCSILDGKRGQIIWAYKHWSPPYRVRFSSLSARTDTHILGNDDDIKFSPYSDVGMEEFELKDCK